MTDKVTNTEPEGPDEKSDARRTFLKLASQVAVTTPAVTLLLSAGGKRAYAGGVGYAPDSDGQDGTSGGAPPTDDSDGQDDTSGGAPPA